MVVVMASVGLVLASFGPLALAPAAAGSVTSGGPEIVISTGTDEPGEISISLTVRNEAPFTLTFSQSQQSRIDDANVSTSGFTRTGEGRYRYTGGQGELTYTYRTGTDSTLENASVDQGSWAAVLVQEVVPEIDGRQVVPSVDLDGPGVVRGGVAYLGDYETHTGGNSEQTFHLIVPDDAVLVASPETIIDSLSRTTHELDVGERDSEVFVIALPTRGIRTQYGGFAGGQRMVVRDDVPATTAGDTWVHEYVHTRQGYTPTSDIEWFTEASATYYGSYHLLHQHRVSFTWFRGNVATADYREAILANPDSWSERMVPYTKGARVLAYLDTQIRAASDGDRTLEDVFRRMNDVNGDRATANDFYGIVADVANDSVANEVHRYATTKAAPPVSDDPHAFTEDAEDDPDGDGLTNEVERDLDSNPFAVDTDGDGLDDEKEHRELGTDPTQADSDGDGRPDGAEGTVPRTDPLGEDTDGDGIGDMTELEQGTDPTAADTDGDGLDDVEEIEPGSNPRWADTDGDGLTDADEVASGTDPTAVDSDGDGLPDSRERDDTDPAAADTDGDGYDDLDEMILELDPRSPTDWVGYNVAVISQLAP